MVSSILRFTISKFKKYFVNYLLKSKPDDERVTRFADYLLDVVISEEAQYSLEIWAQASAEPL
jgi:hypothetical protein